MTFFNASFESVLIRYYLMMAIIIIAFFVNTPILAYLGFPLFLSAFMGVSFKKKSDVKFAQIVNVNTSDKDLREAA